LPRPGLAAFAAPRKHPSTSSTKLGPDSAGPNCASVDRGDGPPRLRAPGSPLGCPSLRASVLRCERRGVLPYAKVADRGRCGLFRPLAKEDCFACPAALSG